MYYQITNGQAVPATIANASNPQVFIAAQSREWRHSLGIYAQLIEGDVDQPTAAPEQDAIIIPHPVPQVVPEPSAPSPAYYPDGIETPVVVLQSHTAGYGIGLVADDEGGLATYIDHQSPRPDAAEIARRVTAAIADRKAERDAYRALLDALASGDSKAVQDAAKAAREKSKYRQP